VPEPSARPLSRSGLLALWRRLRISGDAAQQDLRKTIAKETRNATGALRDEIRALEEAHQHMRDGQRDLRREVRLLRAVIAANTTIVWNNTPAPWIRCRSARTSPLPSPQLTWS